MDNHLTKAQIEGRLTQYVQALVAGDANKARDCLSPDFKRHMGRNANDFVDYEISEFRPRIVPYFLNEGIAVKIYDWQQDTNDISYFVFNARGQMIYEEQNRIDHLGRLKGDDGIWEFISKLKFRKADGGGVDVIRALCLRHQSWKPTGVLIYNHTLADISIEPSGYDSSATVCEFNIHGDDGKSLTADIMVTAGIPGSRERRSILMRGTDHPHYLPNIFPRIDGRSIHIPDYPMIYWALNVETADGRLHKLYHPSEKEYVFDHDIVFAVLNDAVDNDWEVVAPR